MKKTLAIVLALVMVLAMIPAMSADVTENKTITDKQYYLNIFSWNDADVDEYKEKVNTITLEYDYENINADVTGKWTENAKMALVQVGGFDADFTTAGAKITIDGKELKLDGYAPYKAFEKYSEPWTTVTFPVELTKAGYTDTFLVQVTETKDGKTTTETAKITVVLKNTHPYKGAEVAKVTNIATSNSNKASTYIVGDKIYVDCIRSLDEVTATDFKVTFADENGKAFTAITYAYTPKVWNGSAFVTNCSEIDVKDYSKTENGKSEKKLKDSAVEYHMLSGAAGEKIKFVLETAAADYETKAYTIVMRGNIKEEDPKGIYFAETTKTIAMGETYAPVVLGVKTGKPVAATLKIEETKTDAEVIDLNDDKNAVIGTREGVAYITAEYTADMGLGTKYDASSMKIIVTLPGESIPEVEAEAEIYYVTCRNLNVRAGGSTSYKKVDMIHRGDAVKVLEIKNGWAKLDNGTYVCAKYIAK